jgi:hypothetical protein
MQNISQIEEQLTYIMEERAPILARETQCIQRERKFDGAALLQMLVCGWLAHPNASLEQLASMVATRDVLVTDTAVHSRFNEPCAHFLHAVLQELTAVVVQADHDVPLKVLHRFSNVIIEESSSIALPDELAEIWQGCGGHDGQGQAAVKIHVRWEIKRGQMWGPSLTNGRASDRSSPGSGEALPIGSFYVADLGYFNLDRIVARRAAKSYTLTRPQSSTAFFTEEGKRLQLKAVLPQRVGQTKEMPVLVGIKQRHPMRLLMMRVPSEVAEQRCERLRAEAARLQKQVSDQALELCKWLLLLTDAPAKRLSLQEAIVLQRERWQIELL